MHISIDEAIRRYRDGELLIMTDSEDRENEGDFIMRASAATPDDVNFVAQHGRGLLCAAISEERALALQLPPMTPENTASMGTNFTVSIDVAKGATTGISCADRALTLNRMAAADARPDEFLRPGHMFPVVAREGGTLRRPGHTEGTVDLARLAGVEEVGLMCEILKPDGSMARLPDLEALSERFGIPIVTIHDLITWRLQRENHIRCDATAPIRNETGVWQMGVFEDAISGEAHTVAILGDLEELAVAPEPLARIHSQCFTGDTFGSMRCDCGPQLRKSMELIAEEGCGVLIYMNQEGRGIGLKAKLQAYALQDKGRDTVEANLELGYKADMREYGASAQILKYLGLNKVRLLTNNPDKVTGIERFGLMVQRIPLEVGGSPHNAAYLDTKREKMGHLLDPIAWNTPVEA